MTWDLPFCVEIGENSYKIRNKCDYRVVLDCIAALNDMEMSDEQRVECALYIFYEDVFEIEDIKTAFAEMVRIINGGGEKDSVGSGVKPMLMDWEQDFDIIAPPVSEKLGYEVRMPDKYTHWYTFFGAFREIGECTFMKIVNIRSKRSKGQKLDKAESEYMREHRNRVELKKRITAEERALLESPW